MISERFTVNSDAGRMAAARYAAEDFARSAGLSARDTLRLNLLVEETLGMVKAMVEEFYGQLWFSGEGKRCEIHLQATSEGVTGDTKDALMDLSRTGKNVLTKGFMAAVGEFLGDVIRGMGRGMDGYCEGMAASYGPMPMGGAGGPVVYDMTPVWSLQSYRSELDRRRETDAEAGQTWDALEKSIVARLADDVVVGVKGARIELVIVKEFGKP